MLTQEDDVEIQALARRGWSQSAIARHTGRDRKTVAKYLARPTGERREPALSRVVLGRERGMLVGLPLFMSNTNDTDVTCPASLVMEQLLRISCASANAAS